MMEMDANHHYVRRNLGDIDRIGMMVRSDPDLKEARVSRVALQIPRQFLRHRRQIGDGFGNATDLVSADAEGDFPAPMQVPPPAERRERRDHLAFLPVAKWNRDSPTGLGTDIGEK